MNYNFSDYWVVAWLSRNSIGHNNEVTLCRARLVLGWVITHEFAILVCNHPLSLLPSVGQYQPRSSGWEGNCRSGIVLAMHHSAQWPNGDDHHTYTALRSMATFTITLLRLNIKPETVSADSQSLQHWQDGHIYQILHFGEGTGKR